MREFFARLARQASTAGGRPAVTTPDGSLSYERLLARVRATAQWSGALPRRVGLLVGTGLDAIVADLALTFAGKELVPLPAFFSDAQLGHIIAAAQLSHAVADRNLVERARRLGLVTSEPGASAVPAIVPALDATRIIFTSGTTGNPKGVRLSSRQMLASIAALGEVTGATAADRYLSLLPSALLLEQIAGTYLPLSVGAEIGLPGSQSAHPARAAADAAEMLQPTATVLVPELLAGWLHELHKAGRRAPASLRYVAVGGAPVAPTLAAAAWSRGLPVHEGYGLSECCSVVAVNRVNDRRGGTVGRPLPNVDVAIEGGEILVRGPTVMDGYLGESHVTGTDASRTGDWRTGDLGHFDPDGFLVVTGRKDNVIVTSAGRNISPEWVEDAVLAEARIHRCVAVEHAGELVAVVVPRDPSAGPSPAISDLVRDAVRAVPDYAKPRRLLVMTEEELHGADLLTANFRPRRAAIRRFVSQCEHRLSQPA
jgi:long-chain acyl-CoA synthetase